MKVVQNSEPRSGLETPMMRNLLLVSCSTRLDGLASGFSELRRSDSLLEVVDDGAGYVLWVSAWWRDFQLCSSVGAGLQVFQNAKNFQADVNGICAELWVGERRTCAWMDGPVRWRLSVCSGLPEK